MTDSNLFSFKHLPTINTERLLLRDIQADDAKAIWSYSNNPVFYQSMGRSAPTSKDKVLSNIQNILSGEDTRTPRNWMVVLKSSGKIIGDCGFNEYRPSNLRGEVNYAIDPAYWNQGFATEAVLRVIEFGFEEIGLNRIQAICSTENKVSERVIQKTGMKYEGLLRNYIQCDGKVLDMKMYSLLKYEWQSERK